MNHFDDQTEYLLRIDRETDLSYVGRDIPETPTPKEELAMWDADPLLLGIADETEDAYAERDRELKKEELTDDEYDANLAEFYTQADDIIQGEEIKQTHTLSDLLNLADDEWDLGFRGTDNPSNQPTAYDDHILAKAKRADRIRWG
tara:strand:+ start:373 stop:810 length:438 start_codon:yes stop_codon:yes gene_type:complete